MSDPDFNYIRVRADTVIDPLIRRLTDPPFGTETSERNLMTEAAARIADLERQLAADAKAHEKEIAVWAENYAALERQLADEGTPNESV